ncbi:zona pellucida sperm-binding protein 3-like isoform X1 [Corythoichthys intestinalis]|uniref:zona pellucida sperm-binding protein 3-like isoform X1 n=1 Tax=Corythoichthys intestinalis TaxID=161448 RepID=UPI0025A66F70|nr:zona pellucida sperm-binding protein 3-like isoform X1 [Corythoichthys intestinalis]
MLFWRIFFGLLLSVPCAALQIFSTNETHFSNQSVQLWTPVRQQTTFGQSNRTEPSQWGNSAVSRRIRIHQLKRPAVEERVQILPTPEPDVQDEVLKIAIQGPDLDPPVEPDPKMAVDFEQRVPKPADSLAVQCGEGEVIVEVKQNFFGNGQLIRPSDLTLGGCGLLRQDDRVLLFRTELHGCGGTAKMTDEALIYTFSLAYSPTPVGDSLVFKTNPSEVQIECHYPRKHYVSSHAVMPHWQQFASSLLTEQQLRFSLRLLTEDHQSQRSTGVYLVGEMIHLEASVLQGYHIPLRVYVDSCVVTLSAAPNSQPAYTFIDNHGCLKDAKLTGAKSYFMQRSSEDKLAFQVKAFNFQKDGRNSLYITCRLTATVLSVPISSRHKACSFLVEANRWVASGGDNKVCSCCESSCSEQRWKRNLREDAAGLQPHIQWEGSAILGPIRVKENTTRSNSTRRKPKRTHTGI